MTETRTLTFTGARGDDQRARLMGIAERCPVHRTLPSEVLVATTEDRSGGLNITIYA